MHQTNVRVSFFLMLGPRLTRIKKTISNIVIVECAGWKLSQVVLPPPAAAGPGVETYRELLIILWISRPPLPATTMAINCPRLTRAD